MSSQDQKLTELTAIDSVSAADLLYIVDDPSGTPTSKKATAQQLWTFKTATCRLYDTADTYYVTLKINEALSANRTLNIKVGSGDRTIDLTGNIVLAGTLTTAAAFTTSGAYGITLTATNTTAVTLPTTGTLATLAGTEEFDNKTLDSSVGKGTWTASGTWTLPALTLGGAITYGGVTLSNAVTGTGAMVLANTPTLITPVLGVATATSINKVALTAPATGSTLTIADGKTLTCSNTLTFTGTDSSSVAFGAGGTVAFIGSNNAFTGANTFVNATGQTFRPAATQDAIILLGRAGGTGSYAVTLGTGTLSDNRAINFPNAAGTVALTADKLSAFAATTSAELAGVISDETGSGALVFGTTPTFTTSAYCPLIYGSAASNGDLTLEGTSDGTKTTSYVILQPTAGNVGIGTTSPGAKMVVKGGNTNDLIVDNDGSQYTEFDFANNGTNKFSTYWDNVNSYFSLGGVLQFSSGSVGIGTVGPDAKLDVLSTTEQLRLTYTDGSVYTAFTTSSTGTLTIQPYGASGVVSGIVSVANDRSGATVKIAVISEDVTIAAGTATKASTNNLLPANSTILDVSYRLKTDGGAIATIDIGLAANTDLYINDGVCANAGDTGQFSVDGGDGTAGFTTPHYNATAATLTAVTDVNTTGDSVVTISVAYIQHSAATK